MFKQFFILVLVLAGLSGCSEPARYYSIDNAQLKNMLEQGAPIFDIRRPEEWHQTGVVAGSQKQTFVDASGRLMPDFLPQFTQQVGKQDTVILICRTGNRSSVLARHLSDKLGYTNVYNVKNGITDWIRSGGPVTKN